MKKYTITQAAKYLGLSRSAIYHAIKVGRLLPCFEKTGTLFDKKDLEAYKASPARPQARSAEVVQSIVTLHKAGYNDCQIALATGRKQPSIWMWRKKLCLKANEKVGKGKK